jgi:hypothetical protein
LSSSRVFSRVARWIAEQSFPGGASYAGLEIKAVVILHGLDRPNLFRQAVPVPTSLMVSGDGFGPIPAPQSEVAAQHRGLEAIELAQPGGERCFVSGRCRIERGSAPDFKSTPPKRLGG